MLNEDNLQYINKEEALGRLGGSQAIFKRLLGMFMQSEEFGKLEAELAEENYAGAAEVAHAIKGITGNLSLSALFEYSTALMGQLRQGAPDPETLRKYKEALEKTRELVQQEIDAP